jgi:tetratricopeptide (TPR) repeat protein
VANDSLDFVQRGKVSIVRRQYAEAVKICRLGLLGQPSLLEGRLVLGMALTALGRWDEVLAEMRVALETDANAPLAWLLKGEALVGKGDYQQAEATLKRAKELDPGNPKADQLLAEIATARAAGFDGMPAEPTDTKVYPAKAEKDTNPELGHVVKPMPVDRGERVDLPPDDNDDISVEYDEATEVDPDPSNRLKMARDRGGDKPASVLVNFSDDENEDTVEDSQIGTETFLNPRGSQESSYESPAEDDYTENARPRVVGHVSSNTTLPEPKPRTDDDSASLEILRDRALPKLSAATSRPLRAVDDLPSSESEVSEPAIPLNATDLIVEESRDGFPRGFAPTFDSEDEEDEQTRQRRQRQNDEHAGTSPEAPDPVLRRQRTPRAAFDPLPSPPRSQPSFPRSSNEMPTELGRDGSNPNFYGAGEGNGSPYDLPGEAPPGVVRVPVNPIRSSGRMRQPRPTALVRDFSLPWWDRSRRGVLLLLTALVAVIAVGVATGLLVREWRMRARVAKRHELARQRIASGNYPGFQAAELLYRQILAERDDPPARSMRARVLAQMAFEFGDSPEPAQRAVAGLGDENLLPCVDGKPGCADAAQARVYLALASGDLDRAERLAQLLKRKVPDAGSSYLVGRAELLLDRPDGATDALRNAAEGDAHNPLVLHGLGLAEAAAHRDDRAYDAYRRALEANANHIATIVDRALLQVARGTDREAARGALEGVVGKLVGDSSPGQLARAFLGLAELELQKGDIAAARRDLAQAAAKRRDGDALLSEQLAQAFADAYMLDEAEREAKRAIAAAGRLQPRLVLAEVALKRAKPQQALAVIEEAGTSRPEALVMRALASLSLGRNQAARLDAEAALRVQPDLVGARVALARLDLAEGHPERAQKSLEALERTSQKTPEVAAALGQVYVAGKAMDRARWWFKEALKRDPLDLDARLSLAKLMHDAGQFDAARDELKQVLLANAGYVPARRELGLVALDAGDAVAARDELDALVGEESVDLDTLENAARAHLMLGDGPGAIERLQRALKMTLAGPTAEELIDLQARALLLMRQPVDAVQLLRKLLPTAFRGETLALLMEAYIDQEQFDRANEVVKLGPPRARTGVELLVSRARLHVERGHDSVAEGFATEALQRMRSPRAPRPVKSEAYRVLGRALYDQGSFRSALKALRSATELDPRSAGAWYYLGLVDEDLKRLPDAKVAYETAVKVDPKFADALYYLGRLRAQLGDETARDAYQQYLEIAPKGTFADDVRAALKSDMAPAPMPTSSPPRIRRRGR